MLQDAQDVKMSNNINPESDDNSDADYAVGLPYVDGCLDILAIRDKGLLQTIRISDRGVDPATVEIRNQIRQAVFQYNGTKLESWKHISNKPWQIATSAELIALRDVITTTATEDGKTMCYFLPLLLCPNGMVLVVSPLLTLMEDQAVAVREMGFAATYVSD